MGTKTLIVHGGWDGHTPKECADLWCGILEKNECEIIIKDTLEAYTDEKLMSEIELIIPMWTMGEISQDQEKALLDTVKNGTGIAGFHGGMCDSFRNNTDYQWMTGGQWVAHPGGCIPHYDVSIIDTNHWITRGLNNFTMKDTEQYYLHVDPSNHLLAETTFQNGCVMPVAWTREWGKGRVFYTSIGHTYKDFEIDAARELTLRGMLWAAGRDT